MGRLTGGSIEFTERRKIGDYEHRDCKITLHFAFEDGGFEPSYFDSIQHEIRARVQAMVAHAPLPKAESSWAKAVDEVAVPTEPKKRGRPKAKVVEPEPDEPEVEDDEADDFMEDEDEPEEAMSNDDLSAIVKKTHERVKDAAKLRHLVEVTFESKSVKAIPQEKRKEFVAALAKLK